MEDVMNLNRPETVQDLSRELITKHGVFFRTYGEDKETLERWASHLSFIYKKRFIVQEDIETTLHDWTQMIGG